MNPQSYSQLGVNLEHMARTKGISAAADLLERNIPNLTPEQYNKWFDMIKAWEDGKVYQ
jgi:hypothetical protein